MPRHGRQGSPSRRPTIRREFEQRMSKVGDSGIYYSDGSIIGSGSTSIVYKGFFKTPDKKVAVKRVFSKFANLSKYEIEIWLKVAAESITMENINIVQLYHWTIFREDAGEENYYFAMELALSDLEIYIQEMVEGANREETRDQCVGFLKDAAAGLQWLHNQRVIHRDIKPQNILIFCQPGGKQIAKLGDFGVSKIISSLATSETQTEPKGTLQWLAPEALLALDRKGGDFRNTKALDIFSFGMTINYALTLEQKKHPFDNGTSVLVVPNILNTDIRPNLIGNHEYAADHLSRWMMGHTPNQRPNIRQVTFHPAFWDEQRQLDFVLEVGKGLDRPSSDESAEKVKEKLDKEYMNQNCDFDWKRRLQADLEKLSKRRSEGNDKKVKANKSLDSMSANSLRCLIKLIRDKNVHHPDLVDELITEEYFGLEYNNNQGDFYYCPNKYGRWFFKKFPNLVMFLFWFLVKDDTVPKLRSLNTVKKNFHIDEYPRERFPDLPVYNKRL